MKTASQAANEVIEVGTRKLEANPKDVVVLSRLAVTYATMGEIDKAREAVRRVIEIDPDNGVALYNCAGAYACLGMREEVLSILEKSLQRGMWKLDEWIEIDPSLGSIRDDPKFKQIFSKYSV